MANPAVQSLFNPEVENDPEAGLLAAFDELCAVEEGLWGLMTLICENRKTVKLDAGRFHFAVEPLLFRLGAAAGLLDRSRLKLREVRAAARPVVSRPSREELEQMAIQAREELAIFTKVFREGARQ